MEELLTCPHWLSQAKALRTKVGPMARSSHLHSDFVQQPRVSIMHYCQVTWASWCPLRVLVIHRGLAETLASGSNV